MKEFKAIVAKSVTDKQNSCFTQASLQQLAGKNLSLSVMTDFKTEDIIGTVIELEFKDSSLIATIRLNKDYDLKDKVFRVWGKINSSHKEKDRNIINDWGILGLGMIDKGRDVYPEEKNEI